MMFKRAPLTEAERHERSIAGKASAEARHRAETSPSVKQGSTSAPSGQATGLFRQGQSRPDTRASRSVWDTRSTEPPVGSVNGVFTFHVPKAYVGDKPEKAALGRRSMARALARAKGGPHQDVVITNPERVAIAQQHPGMRALVSRVAAVVRDHQVGAIEQGHARGLIPEGSRPGSVVRAYKHAALRAMHKAGLGDYDTSMDDAAKAEFTPLVPFMRYVSRRVFDHLNQGELKGAWQPFRDEFGQLYRQKKFGQLTGHERMRMRPVDQFIKLELPELDLEKAWNAAQMDQMSQSSGDEDQHSPTEIAPPAPSGGPRWTNFSLQDGFSSAASGSLNQNDGQSDQSPGLFALANTAIARGAQGLSIPLPPGGVPKISGAASMTEQAQAVEDHFGIPRIGGSTIYDEVSGLYRVIPVGELAKIGFGSDYTTDPKRQLARAMRPRLRRQRMRLRLNTQRDLRHVLNGGVTRQERWQLGAGGAMPAFKSFPARAVDLVKRLLTEHEVRAAARSVQIPTKAQAIAGNYQKGHLTIGGLGISIETPKGRMRRGVSPDGKAWSVAMPAHYGYVKKTTGADGDHVDVYLGPHAAESEERPVHVIDQHRIDGPFDEHKACLGFASRDQAIDTYDRAFSDGRGPQRRQAVHTMTFGDFKQWLGDGDTTAPLQKFAPLDDKHGHGHVTPRADGIKARCGGPGLCSTCARAWQDKYGTAFPDKGPVRKAALGAALRAGGKAFGRLPTRAKLGVAAGAGVGAGLAAPHVDDAVNNPVNRGIAGAALAGGGAALLARGHAAGAVRGLSRKLYQTGLHDALREHVRVLAGATPSPQLKAAARKTFVAAKQHALHEAKTARSAGLRRIRTPYGKIAGAAAAGGLLAAASGKRYTAPPLYQAAAESTGADE